MKANEIGSVEAYIIGAILSDGYVHRSSYALCLDVTDEEFIDAFSKAVFDFTGKVIKRGKPRPAGRVIQLHNGVYRTAKPVLRCRLCSKEAYEKIIENIDSLSWVYEVRNDIVLTSLLQGLWDGEGSVSCPSNRLSTRVEFSNKDKEIILIYRYLIHRVMDIKTTECHTKSGMILVGFEGALNIIKFFKVVQPSINRKWEAYFRARKAVYEHTIRFNKYRKAIAMYSTRIYTQQEVGILLGLPQNTISRWVRGNNKPYED